MTGIKAAAAAAAGKVITSEGERQGKTDIWGAVISAYFTKDCSR